MDRNKWYQETVEKVIEQMKVEFGNELLGILLGRSVASGTKLKQSDLDIYVIIRSSWRQRRVFVVTGVDVELWINPAHQIQRSSRIQTHQQRLTTLQTGAFCMIQWG